MKFSDFLGNEAAKTVLYRAVCDENALRHAYLLTGPKGVGKRTLANLFIRALLCRGEDRPCGECLPCKKVDRQIHPDVLILRPPEGKDAIPAESIRTLREFLYLLPNEAEKKVVLIENAESMTLTAANALLKMLEEPPSYAVFVLLAENRSLLLETISSRCLVLPLFEPGLYLSEKYLARQYEGTAPALLENALLYGGGNLGRSIRYLGEEEVQKAFEETKNLFFHLDRGEFFLLKTLSEYERDRDGFLTLLENLDRLSCAAAEHRDSLSLLEASEKMRSTLSQTAAARLHFLCEETMDRLKQNASLGLSTARFAGALSTVAG